MRKLSAVLLVTTLAFTGVAHAIPNMWTSGFGMGVTEYIITSPENVMFNLNCTGNPDEQNILQHHVMLTFPDGSGADSHDDHTAITLVINDRLWDGVMRTMPGRSLLRLWDRLHILMCM